MLDSVDDYGVEQLVLVRERGGQPEPELGLVLAELVTLRQLSRDVALAIQAGQVPAIQAAIVKDLGTRFENRVIKVALRIAQVEPDPGADRALDRLLAQAVLHAPAFTLRGGTNEILRGIVARTVTQGTAMTASAIADSVGGVLRAGAGDGPGLYAALHRDDWTAVGIPEAAGGSGGGLAQAGR